MPVKVRDYLNQNGITNDRIGYDNASKSVLVDNKPFIKPNKVLQGTSFSEQADLNQALSRFNKPPVQNTSQQPTQQVQPAQQPTQSFAHPTPQPTYADRYGQLIDQLFQQSSEPQTPYNVYATPEFAAYKTNAMQQAHDADRAAQEAFGTSGFARSTDLASTISRDRNQANAYLDTQVVPQLIAQHRAEEQQKLNDKLRLIDLLMGADQQQFSQGITQAGVTGQYQGNPTLAAQQLTGNVIDPQKQALYEQMQANSAAWGAASPEERQRLHQENLSIAQQLGMTYDPATGTYTQPDLSVPTLANQQFQYQQQQDAADREYQQERDAIADERYQQEIEREAQQFAARQGLDWAQLSQRQKEFMVEQANREKQDQSGRLSQDQINAYNELLGAYTDQSYDPVEAFNFATSPQGKKNALDYGLTEGLYNQMVSQLESRIPQSSEPSKNDITASYIEKIDQIPPDKLAEFFSNEKSTLIRNLGVNGYNDLKKMYGLYN